MKTESTSLFAKFKKAGVAMLALAAVLTLAPAGSASVKPQRSLPDGVRHELLMLPYLSVFDNLSYRVNDNGVVELFGEVVRPVLRSDAENVVKKLEGVTRVENHIEVLPLSPFDNRIRFATARAIYGFTPLNRYGMGTQPSIRIIVKNGNVTLAGVVNSEMDRNMANIRANSVPGVFSVTNDLVVSKN
jgi:hyperosmotically inducible protein